MNLKAHSKYIFVILVLIVSISNVLDLTTGIYELLFILIGIGFALRYLSLSDVFVSFALFGQPFVWLLNENFGISMTVMYIGFILIYLAYLVKCKDYNSKYFHGTNHRKFLILITLLYFLVFLNYILGPMTPYSTYYVQFFLVYCTFTILAALICVVNKTNIEDILLFSILLVSIIYNNINLSVFDLPKLVFIDIGLRATEGFSCLHYARICSLLCLISLLTLISAKNRENIILAAVGLSISLPIVWFSYTRQAIIALIIVTMIIFLSLVIGKFSKYNIHLKKGRRYIAILLLSVCFCFIYKWFSYASVHFSTARIFTTSVNLKDSQRIYTWEYTWEYIKERPLSGYGIGGLSTQKISSWPHNIYLEAWGEYGLPGLAFFLICTYYLLHPLIFNRDNWVFKWSILGLFWLLVVQLSCDIPRNYLIFMFISIGVLNYKKRSRLLRMWK